MASVIDKIRNGISKARQFVESRTETLTDENATLLDNLIPVTFLVWKSFVRNRCPVRATALSYTTLLALVPLLAIGVSITGTMFKEQGTQVTDEMIVDFVDWVAPGLVYIGDAGSETNAATDQIDGTISTNVPPTGVVEPDETNLVALASIPLSNSIVAVEGQTGYAEVVLPIETSENRNPGAEQLASMLNGLIDNFHSTSVGISGLLGFFVVAILLLSTIETTFNDIWGVTRGRSWFRRLIQYWTAISLGPLLIVSAVLLKQGSEFQAFQELVSNIPGVGNFLVLVMVQIFPLVVVSLGFALVYKLMPNTQVDWQAALTGGAVGGCLWLIVNFANATNMSKVVTMNKLYGSLALIPVFLIGLYMSWLIVLFGAQVAYALQNRKVYFQERRAEAVSQRGCEFVAMRVMMRICHRFHRKVHPPTILELAHDLSVSSRLVARVLHALLEAKLVIEVADEDASFTPARPLEAISCQDVLHALRVGINSDLELSTENDPCDESVLKHFTAIGDAEKAAADPINMKQLVEAIPLENIPPERPSANVGERVLRWERQLS